MSHVFTISNSDSMMKYLNKVMQDVNLGTIEAINETVEKIGKETAKRVRDASPERTGKYKRGWRYRAKKVEADGSFSTVVYNAKYGWLTHLIENGHPIKTKDGVKQVKGQPHISEVNKWVQTEGLKQLADAIQREIKKIN